MKVFVRSCSSYLNNTINSNKTLGQDFIELSCYCSNFYWSRHKLLNHFWGNLQIMNSVCREANYYLTKSIFGIDGFCFIYTPNKIVSIIILIGFCKIQLKLLWLQINCCRFLIFAQFLTKTDKLLKWKIYRQNIGVKSLKNIVIENVLV